MAFILGWLQRLGASQADLLIENLALRQQLAILTTKRPRPRMGTADRFFWLTLRRFWPRWKEALVVIRPDTVVCWHRQGFKKYWTWKSRRRSAGRPLTRAEIRALVRRMAAENLTWGAPRVHGELLMLGFDVSERSVSRMMPRRPADPESRQRWRNFLCNHREVLAEFVAYDHDDRTHLGLNKGTPSTRVVISKPTGDAEVVGHPRIGGLHHRYEWREAA